MHPNLRLTYMTQMGFGKPWFLGIPHTDYMCLCCPLAGVVGNAGVYYLTEPGHRPRCIHRLLYAHCHLQNTTVSLSVFYLYLLWIPKAAATHSGVQQKEGRLYNFKKCVWMSVCAWAHMLVFACFLVRESKINPSKTVVFKLFQRGPHFFHNNFSRPHPK